MKLKDFKAAAIVMLLAMPGAAQSAAEQLQKGVYLQQTAGDLDSAIQIFRQIVASNPAERVFAAQAQMHLAQALLQKGDLNAAATEFGVLAANFGEFHEMVAAMAKQMAGVQQGRTFSKGTVFLSQGEPDRYQHRLTGVALVAPPGWQLDGDGPAPNEGEQVTFRARGPSPNVYAVAVWLKPTSNPGVDPAVLLRRDVANKKQTMSRYPDWTLRPQSIQTLTVAGQPAMSAIADYTYEGAARVEYLIWVRSQKNHVLFFGHANPAGLSAVEAVVNQLAATAVVP